MGQDKAGLVLGRAGRETPGRETLGVRTARLLRAVAEPVIEVGGSATDLPRVADLRPFAGPLAALADAGGALRTLGWAGPVLVVATDLPLLSGGMLAWLAGHPSPAAVVPLDRDGRPQPLCARYPWAAVELAEDLVALLEKTGPLLCPPADWAGPAGGTDVLADVDTPADLADLGCAGQSDGGRFAAGRADGGRDG
jgi:molybdopterin-guanine dinucleotide biosynthesis protein A